MNISFYLHDEIDPREFERTILWFKAHFNLISASQLHSFIYDGVKSKNSCMLSVDDGWRSTYDVIFPIMAKHSVPFTIFVSPEIIENEGSFWTYSFKFCNDIELKQILIRRRYFDQEVMKYPVDLILKELTIDIVYDVINEYLRKHPEISIPRGFISMEELREMHASGLVEVGAHTLTHPILKNEDDIICESEIKGSVERLSDMLNYRVHTFAYPNGLKGVDFGEREMNMVREAGIDMAFSVDPGIISRNTNPLAIPRWGSLARLKFGFIGQYLPSRANQSNIRTKIRQLKLK